jgi:hypothetical protein
MQDDGILAAYNNGSLYWSTKPKSQTSTPTTNSNSTTNSNPATTSTAVNVRDNEVTFCVGACPTGKTGCVLAVNKDTVKTECGTIGSGQKYSFNLTHIATNTWKMQSLVGNNVCNIYPGNNFPRTGSWGEYHWGDTERIKLFPNEKTPPCDAKIITNTYYQGPTL